MSRSDLDGTDHEILALLTEDARRPLVEIGKRVCLSTPAVKRRIDRLERLGVITGYTVVVDEALLGKPLEAFTEVRFAGTTALEDIIATAAGLPEVKSVFTTAGDPDALVWMQVRDTAHLKRVIDRFRRSGPVTGTKTLIVLERWSQTAADAAHARLASD